MNAVAKDFSLTEGDFSRVRAMIYQRAGIALSEQKREMVYSRLSRRLRELKLTDFTTYLNQLENGGNESEWQAFTNALTTNLTSFFRESHHFPLLAQHVRQRTGPVSVWCCAASTGEEPYSLAITLADALGTRTNQASILATDIDTQVLQKAKAAIYTAEQSNKLSQDHLKKYFLKGTGANAGRVRVRSELAAMIRFAPLNLLAARWEVEGPFDVIFCRNVMIYFDKPTQARILQRFAPLLKPDGLLFAGHSENFSYVDQPFRLRGQTVYELVPQAAHQSVLTAPGSRVRGKTSHDSQETVR